MSRFVIDSTTNSTFIPSSYDSTNSVVRTTGNVNNGLKDTSSTASYAIIYLVTGSEAISHVYYNFDCSSIPQNAAINSVSCKFRAGAYSNTTTTQKNNYGNIAIGTTLVGTQQPFTTDINTVKTINSNHNFTRSDLDNIKIYLTSQRGTNSSYYNSTSVNFKFYGAELDVNYSVGHYEYDVTVSTLTDVVTVPQSVYYVSAGSSQNIDVQISDISKIIAEDNNNDITSQLTLVSNSTYRYTLTNVNADHNIVFSKPTIDIDDEDPQYNYYTVSISSVNAETVPLNGFYRYKEGSGATITITPSDPQLTLALDNGVDISSQLVQGVPLWTAEYTTSKPSGASYTFTKNASDWYENGNTARNTYAIARISLNLDIECLVTIKYYGSIQSTREYVLISQLDQTLANSVSNDSGTKVNVSSINSASTNPSTVSYTNVQGQHTIDFKVSRQNQATSTNVTHKVYFQVEITPLDPIYEYTYTLSNIQSDHSLIFVYGDIQYYIINSSTSDNLKLFPTGDWVCLPNETYKLTVIPENILQTISVTDNNSDVSQYVQRYEFTEDGVTDVNYAYKIFNVNANHTITVSGNTVSSNSSFIKKNGSFVEVSKMFTKTSGSWVERTLSSVFWKINGNWTETNDSMSGKTAFKTDV